MKCRKYPCKSDEFTRDYPFRICNWCGDKIVLLCGGINERSI